MARRHYSAIAAPTSLTANIDNTATVLSVASTAGYPVAPFLLALERGTASAEVCLCTALTGTSFTVTRGYDGTTPAAHNTGAAVEHTVSAIDYDEANAHINVSHIQVASAAPTTSAVGDAAAVGTVIDAARNDHRHGREAFATPVALGGPGGTNSAGVAATIPRSDHVHATPTSAPVASSPGDVVATGTSGAGYSAADHKHAREAWGTAITTSAPGDAAGGGASGTVARADHRHGREAFGGVPGAQVAGGAGAAGTAGTVPHSDHVHPMSAATAATQSLPGDAAAVGTGTDVARADHKHSREPYATVITAATPGGASAAGTAANVARGDHAHGLSAATPPAASAPGDTAAVGTGTDVARADHRHAREASASVIFPTGFMAPFGGSAAPTGWLLCDGAAVSRTTYATLYAAVGTTYGAGDGSTTFNVPDARGRVLVGAGTGTGLTARTLGQKVGEESHVLTAAEMPSHNHGVNDPNHTHGITDPGHHHDGTGDGGAGSMAVRYGPSIEGLVTSPTATRVTFSLSSTATTGVTVSSGPTGITTQNAGSGNSHNVMQPSLVVSMIIKT